MYKIETNLPKTSGCRRMCDMNIGELAQIVDPNSPHFKAIVLKTVSGCIHLQACAITWHDNCSQAVELLPKGTVITLTVQ